MTESNSERIEEVQERYESRFMKKLLQEEVAQRLDMEEVNSMTNTFLAKLLAVLETEGIDLSVPTCEVVKDDGDVCGRDRPCQYHDE